jgi:hypothetical protein
MQGAIKKIARKAIDDNTPRDSVFLIYVQERN